MIEAKIEEQDKIAVQAIPDRYAKINNRRDTIIKKRRLNVNQINTEGEKWPSSHMIFDFLNSP